jgi:hypothetical protein
MIHLPFSRARAGLAGLALAFAGLPALATAPNLVFNGDFETPVTATWRCFNNSSLGGWTNAHPGAGSGSCYTHLDGPAAPALSGQQSMYLNDSSVVGVTLSQDIAVTAGTTYQLSFALTGLTDRPTLPVVQVNLGMGSVPSTFTGLTYGQWQTFSQTFTPLATGMLPLTFTALSGYIYLDAVRVSAVPEPGQWALMVTGLAALGWLGRRRAQG